MTTAERAKDFPKKPVYVLGTGESSGMYGMYLMQESIRQLRGEAYRQVSDVEVAFCQGVGGMFAAAGSIIWTNGPPF